MSALTDQSPPGILWSRVNSGESLPGVLTPTTWSFYGKQLETSLRAGFAEIGMIPASAAVYPEPGGDRFLGLFHGRIAVNVNVGRVLFSGLPFVSGDDVERDMLGSVRSGVTDDGYGNRLLPVLAKAPVPILRCSREAAALKCDIHDWWQTRVASATVTDPRALLREALDRYSATVRLQGRTRMLFQAPVGFLSQLAERAGEPEATSSLISGAAKTEEAEIAGHLWDVANGRMALPDFIALHGFHGPNSSECSAAVWREDPELVVRLLAGLRDRESPAARRTAREHERDIVVNRVLRALPVPHRAAARLLLAVAPGTARALEHSKASLLMTTDGGRAATRLIGQELVGSGALSERDDAFHLFTEELLDRHPDPGHFRELVAERKAERVECLSVDVPETWEGQPEPLHPNPQPKTTRDGAEVTGIGASPGVVEGAVRVVTDSAADTTLEPGDILVCPTTDPSWVGLMSIAGALVIDLGATASHGAIVARELGVPCVIGTKRGTSELRDGDRVRVNGSTGTVEMLERVGEATHVER